MRAAQRKVERDLQKAVNQEGRRLERVLTQEVRKANAKNQRAADRHNARVIADFNRRLRQIRPTSTVRYTVEEQALADRVQDAIAEQSQRETDVFISYARIDGSEVAGELQEHLQSLGVSTWFDAVSMQPGKSQALQMDKGLRSARAGVVLLTPAYIAGRFWTERELGALLHKPTLIPVLHGVTFADVAEYSGILPDLAGFETARDSVSAIAEKIMGAVVLPDGV
jgi:hypothetical protein